MRERERERERERGREQGEGGAPARRGRRTAACASLLQQVDALKKGEVAARAYEVRSEAFISQLQAQLADVDAARAAAEAERAALRSKTAQDKKQLSDMSVAAVALDAELSDLRGQLLALTDEYEQSEEEVAVMRRRVAELSSLRPQNASAGGASAADGDRELENATLRQVRPPGTTLFVASRHTGSPHIPPLTRTSRQQMVLERDAEIDHAVVKVTRDTRVRSRRHYDAILLTSHPSSPASAPTAQLGQIQSLSEDKDTLATQIKHLSVALRQTRDERVSMIDEQQRLAAALSYQVQCARGTWTKCTHPTRHHLTCRGRIAQLEEREELVASLTRIETQLGTVRVQLDERQRALAETEQKLAAESARAAALQSQARACTNRCQPLVRSLVDVFPWLCFVAGS